MKPFGQQAAICAAGIGHDMNRVKAVSDVSGVYESSMSNKAGLHCGVVPAGRSVFDAESPRRFVLVFMLRSGLLFPVLVNRALNHACTPVWCISTAKEEQRPTRCEQELTATNIDSAVRCKAAPLEKLHA